MPGSRNPEQPPSGPLYAPEAPSGGASGTQRGSGAAPGPQAGSERFEGPTPPTEADETRAITARRQPGYDAVFAYIRSLDDRMPPDPVHRNALIWRGVAVALDALNVGCCISSHCVEGDHVLILDQPTPGAPDA